MWDAELYNKLQSASRILLDGSVTGLNRQNLKNVNRNHLWFIKVLSREALKAGKVSLSRNSGFASISFLSSISIIPRADFVSPYFESCSFCLMAHTIQPKKRKTLNADYHNSQRAICK